jgi:hypothetical protein
MTGRTGYLVIAGLLTSLDAAVTGYYGRAICEVWARDIRTLGLLALLAALVANSLANVWAQALSGVSVSLCGRISECGPTATPIPTEARGYGDV